MLFIVKNKEKIIVLKTFSVNKWQIKCAKNITNIILKIKIIKQKILNKFLENIVVFLKILLDIKKQNSGDVMCPRFTPPYISGGWPQKSKTKKIIFFSPKKSPKNHETCIFGPVWGRCLADRLSWCLWSLSEYEEILWKSGFSWDR